MVEERAFAFLHAFHTSDEVGELADVEFVDLAELLEFVGALLVVGKAVMALGDAERGEGVSAGLGGKHEGGDRSAACLEGQHHEVAHQPHVLLVIGGHSGGQRRIGAGGETLERRDAPLDLADGGEVFVELAPVALAEVALQTAGVIHDEVEDAALLAVANRAALGGLLLAAAAEHAFEHEARIALGRHGLAFGAPREVELVGATVAGVAVAGLARGIAAEFEGRQAVATADAGGDHLVNRAADADVAAGGLAGLRAGEKRGAGAGVVAGAVAVGIGLGVAETGDDLEIGLVGFERGERGAELERRAGAGRPPVGVVDAVGHVDEGRAHRRGERRAETAGSGFGGAKHGPPRDEAFENRQ